MAKRYRALVGLNFADKNGKEHRVEAGEVIPERFKIPKAWLGRKVKEED